MNDIELRFQCCVCENLIEEKDVRFRVRMMGFHGIDKETQMFADKVKDHIIYVCRSCVEKHQISEPDLMALSIQELSKLSKLISQED